MRLFIRNIHHAVLETIESPKRYVRCTKVLIVEKSRSAHVSVAGIIIHKPGPNQAIQSQSINRSILHANRVNNEAPQFD